MGNLLHVRHVPGDTPWVSLVHHSYSARVEGHPLHFQDSVRFASCPQLMSCSQVGSQSQAQCVPEALEEWVIWLKR